MNKLLLLLLLSSDRKLNTFGMWLKMKKILEIKFRLYLTRIHWNGNYTIL